ncbi:hypothetical protein PQR02_38235 [Paraburkholderia sediminicola]|uniref:Uncharacterized protein n=1 Tax=Paraburkholderia rhynchosiae TaxID=487049 RepID=A0ACC7NP41_9BURK
MGVIVEFYAVRAAALSLPYNDVRAAANAAGAKSVAVISVNSKAVGDVFDALQGSILDAITGDDSTPERSVLLSAADVVQLDALANDLRNAHPGDEVFSEFADALEDTARAASRRGAQDVLGIST